MIDKKKLIEELLDCVVDATDTETQITSLTMAGMLMNQVMNEALTIPVVSRQSEQLVCEYCNEDSKPTCCDSCLESMVNAVQKAN